MVWFLLLLLCFCSLCMPPLFLGVLPFLLCAVFHERSVYMKDLFFLDLLIPEHLRPPNFSFEIVRYCTVFSFCFLTVLWVP